MTSGFTIKYVDLLTLGVTHEYYSGDCRDFEFIPASDTVQLMRSLRLLPRVKEGRWIVACQVNEHKSPVAPVAGKTLRIGLRPTHPYFGNFTEYGFNPRAAIPVYRNSGDPGRLDAPFTAVPIAPVFSCELSSAVRPVSVRLKDPAGAIVRLKDPAGAVVHAVTVTADAAVSSVSFDLTGERSGLYTVEETFPAETHSMRYYLDPELTSKGVFAIVEITTDAAFHASAPAFSIGLAARTETLKYYVVARKYSQGEMQNLTISDTGFDADRRLQVTFKRVEEAGFDKEEDLLPDQLKTAPEEEVRVVLFKSEALVARRAKSRRGIKLTRNGEALVDDLPQPPAHRSDANMIVHLVKP